jgi:hypothetical protein
LDKVNGLDDNKRKSLREYIRKCWKESGKRADATGEREDFKRN